MLGGNPPGLYTEQAVQRMNDFTNSTTTVIYGLKCPLTEQIHYVGKADVPEMRLRQHLASPTNRASREWISALAARGLVPELVILERVPVGEWQRAEREWITRLRLDGHDLTNVHGGGEGHRPARSASPAQGTGKPRGAHRRVPLDGGALRAIREAAGLSQPAVAKRAGLSVGTVCRLERQGASARVFPHTLTRLGGALGVAREALSGAGAQDL